MTTRGTGSLRALRERNRVRIVDALHHNRTASRSDLARLTGLSRTTVTTVVADLIAVGLVVAHEDATTSQTGRGRPPVLLRLNPAAGAAVGIDFDHDQIRIAVADLSATVLGEDVVEIDVDHAAADAIDAAVEMTDALLVEIGIDRDQIVGAGIGLAGPIDHRTGFVSSAVIMPGWVGVDARDELGRRLGLYVEVDNDANLGALAEASYGAGRGLSDFIYVRLGSGVGAGIVAGGRVHHGAAGLAGEIGHVQVRTDGAVCRCGNRGCLETIAAEGAMAALLRPALGYEVTGREILELVDAGDRGARRVVNDAGRAIGRVLADLCNALNPSAIVVGGELSAAGEPLLGGIRETIDRYALPAAAQDVDIRHGVLGERAEVLGALTLVIGNAERLESAGLAELRDLGAISPVAVGAS